MILGHRRDPTRRYPGFQRGCDDVVVVVLRIRVTIEGSNWQDVDELELPRLPSEGDAVETKYGTCVVVRAEPAPDSSKYAGTIVCRVP
jgi:hypothetical protein